MKIALVITNLQGGGAEKALLNIAQLLLARGHQVWLTTFEHRCDYPLPEGLIWHSLTKTTMSKGWWGKWQLVYRLKKYLTPLKPDLVISTLPFADEITHKAHLPHHHCRIANTLSAEIERLKITNAKKAQRRFKRYQTLYNQHNLIAVSQGVAQDLREYFNIKTIINVIANPFDAKKIQRLANQPLAFNQPYVLHIGRFAAQKRHDLLLDAWQLLNVPYQLVLLTPSEPRLMTMIKERELMDRVMIAGFQTNPYPWMKQAALVVLSSDHEGLPNVLIESLLCGTSVVSTDCPSGPREILGEAGKNCLVPVGNVAALAQAIQEHLGNPVLAQSIDLERYSAESVVQHYEQLAQQGA